MTKEEGKKEVYSVAPWRAVHQEITAPSYSVRTESVTPVLMRNLTDLPPHTPGGGVPWAPGDSVEWASQSSPKW